MEEADRFHQDLNTEKRGDLAGVETRVHLDQVEPNDPVPRADELQDTSRLLVLESADFGSACPWGNSGVHSVDVEGNIDIRAPRQRLGQGLDSPLPHFPGRDQDVSVRPMRFDILAPRPQAADPDRNDALNEGQFAYAAQHIAVPVAHTHHLVAIIEMRIDVYDGDWSPALEGTNAGEADGMIATSDQRQRALVQDRGDRLGD